MKALHSRVATTPPNLAICHSSNHHSLKPPFLVHLPQLPALQNPTFRSVSLKSSTSSSSGSVTGASMAASTPLSTEAVTKPFSGLFVCLGNICRNSAAEGVFTDLVKKRGLDSKFKIDSAGTIDYHEGNQADPGMRAASKRRGIEITSLSRPIRLPDFRDFDLILAMDNQNRADIIEAFNRWKFENLYLRMLTKRLSLCALIARNAMRLKYRILIMVDHKALRRF